MLREDIFDRLQIDSGKRTLGELLQEREAAAQEIRTLRSEIERLRTIRAVRKDRAEAAAPLPKPATPRASMLIRLGEVCEMVGVCRSTIYRWMGEGTFPQPVRISRHAVRWRAEDIEGWCESL